MNSVKRSFATIFAILACLLSLCSCSSSRAEQLTALTSSESKKIKEMSDEIIRCLTENDRDGFCSLFCDQVRQRESFSQEVDAIFDSFPCEVYVTSEVQDSASGGSSSAMGKRTEWYVIPKITYIEILQPSGEDSKELVDRYYGVYYYWKITDTEHPELEGLHYLAINMLNTDNSIEIGTKKWT